MSKHTLKGSSENTFEDQDESDPIIEDLEVGIDALREELHLFANRRGLVVGKLVVNDARRHDRSRAHGPRRLGHPEHLRAGRAQVREEQGRVHPPRREAGRLHRFNEDSFWEKHNCILLTSEGQAARGARRLLQRMAQELKLPIYVLVDNDPWGLYIYSVLKQGSINLAYESMRMAVPERALPRHERVRLQEVQAARRRSQIKLTKEDIARAEQMKAYPWFKDKKWQREIQAHRSTTASRWRSTRFLTKSISFITEEYIPKKLRDRDYLA